MKRGIGRALTQRPILAAAGGSKYRAQRTYVDSLDRTFASKQEATVAVGLALRQELGEITELRFQERFPLLVNGVRVATYVADFVWTEAGACVVADAKGYPTPVYRIKRALMKACWGVEIVEL